MRSHQWQTISICPLLALNSHLFPGFRLTVWQWKMTKFLSVFVLYRRSCMLCASFMQLTQICQVRKINKIVYKWTYTVLRLDITIHTLYWWNNNTYRIQTSGTWIFGGVLDFSLSDCFALGILISGFCQLYVRHRLIQIMSEYRLYTVYWITKIIAAQGWQFMSITIKEI